MWRLPPARGHPLYHQSLEHSTPTTPHARVFTGGAHVSRASPEKEAPLLRLEAVWQVTGRSRQVQPGRWRHGDRGFTLHEAEQFSRRLFFSEKSVPFSPSSVSERKYKLEESGNRSIREDPTIEHLSRRILYSASLTRGSTIPMAAVATTSHLYGAPVLDQTWQSNGLLPNHTALVVATQVRAGG